MSNYYLMAQLPALDQVEGAAPLPITEERYLELCSRFLSKKAAAAVKSLTLLPDRRESATGWALIDAWNDEERQLRMALAGLRAKRMKKTTKADKKDFSAAVMQAAQAAMDAEDPLKAEISLNQYRLQFLESLRPLDGFCDDAVFYYGLKLKLLARMKGLDPERGRQTYREVYASILSGEGREDI